MSRRLRALWQALLGNHRPRVFPIGNRWAIEFVLEGELTVWRTEKRSDALAFADNLARLR